MFGFQPMGFGGGFAPQGFGGMYGPPPMMNMQFAPQGPQAFGGGFQGGFGGGFAPPPQFQPNFGGGFGGGMGPQQPAFGGGMPQGGGFGGFPPQGMFGGGPQSNPPAVPPGLRALQRNDGTFNSPELNAQYGLGPQQPMFGGGGMPQFGMPQPPQGRAFGMPGMEASPPYGGGMGPMPQFGGGQRQPMFGGGGFGGPQSMPQFGGGFQPPQFAMPQFGGLLGFGGGMPSNMGPQIPQQGGGQMGVGNFMQDQLRNAGMGPQRPQNKSMVEAASQQMQDLPPGMFDMRYRGGPMTAEQEAFGAQRSQDMLRMMQMAGLSPTQTTYQRRDRGA